MIQNGSPLEEVAILVDPENVFFPFVERDDFPQMIEFFLKELINRLLRDRIMPAPGYCRLYLERQYFASKAWHEACVKAADNYCFDLYWSLPGNAAESLMAEQVEIIAKDKKAPTETLVFSSDGDIIPAVESLKRWDGLLRKGRVCNIGWKYKFSRYLRLVSSGTVYLEDLLPQTHRLLQRKIARRYKTP